MASKRIRCLFHLESALNQIVEGKKSGDANVIMDALSSIVESAENAHRYVQEVRVGSRGETWPMYEGPDGGDH